ncbi:MAG: WecB/TagA/CpsF family glycosyltransferase [Pseudomonadota bacterium]
MSQSFRKTIFGTPVDLLTSQQTLSIIENNIRQRKRLQHGVVNVAKIIKMRKDKDIFHYVSQSDLINIDGAGVVFGARLLGHKVPERVAGIDLMSDVLTVSERNGFRPYFLGAREQVMQKCVHNIQKKYPRLELAGWRNGYFTETEEDQVVDEIANSNADCLFIGITTPKKERILHQYRDRFNVPFQMGVGGSFDVLAGVTKRAPEIWQKAGCEWLFRMLQEPRRMTGRYMSTNLAFAGLVLKEMVIRERNAKS